MPGPADRPAGTGDGTGGRIDEKARAYIEAIPAAHRPLFDRIHELILRAHPGVAVVWSYQMPTYQAGGRRIHLGVWKHGVSVYGWRQDDDGGFVARHPGLKASTGTIRIRPEDAAAIPDEEFLGLLRPALSSAAT